MDTSKNSTGDKKLKSHNYYVRHSPEFVERIYDMIMQKMVIEKKYRDPDYTADMLAKDVGVNRRCLAAVINNRYRDNFSQMVNDLRVREVQYMLSDPHFHKMSITEISHSVGFLTRQSFLQAFYSRTGITAREYRRKYKNQEEISSSTQE